MDSTNTTTMRTRPGGTFELAGRTVSRIGFGAMQLERYRPDPDQAARVLRRALELGVDHIDTAQYYGDGFVNSAIRDALAGSDEVTVVTKVGADPAPGEAISLRPAQRPEELRVSVEDNLRSLGLEQIPVVNVRRMDVGPAVPMAPDQVVDLADQLAEMIAMRDEGLIGGIGLSSVTLEGLRSALPAGIACVQNAYSLVDRSDEPMVELCSSEHIAWVPYFPLGSAFPGLPKVTDEPQVRAVAAALGRTPSQVGLAWLLQRSANTLLIPGTGSVGHLEENLAVAEIKLDDDAKARLSQIPTRSPESHT